MLLDFLFLSGLMPFVAYHFCYFKTNKNIPLIIRDKFNVFSMFYYYF